MLRTVALLILLSALTGCVSTAYTNVKTNHTYTQKDSRATYTITRDRGKHKEALAILALSGGGSRASYWSAAIMFALEELYTDEELDILGEIDVITSVSGGGLPAAYYAISYPDNDESAELRKRVWEKTLVKELMAKPYRTIWLWRWLWPQNIARYWFTSFDRSDIMAQVFADHLYDRKRSGTNLRFKDVNPERPYLIMNATSGTRGSFGDHFAFTHEQFRKLDSDIEEYEIAKGVMASASFPAIFHSVTLKDFMKYPDKQEHFLHLMDGGIKDNFGFNTIEELLKKNIERYDRVVIIVVDAHTDSDGASDTQRDTRSLSDYIIDKNAMDSINIMLADTRDILMKDFKEGLKKYRDKQVLYYHIQFNDAGLIAEDLELAGRLDKISTDFNLEPVETAQSDIDSAVRLLIVKENLCLENIKRIFLDKEPQIIGGAACTWPPKKDEGVTDRTPSILP
ncbi:MAG: patatin-like phospholipase family protein [Proteobacteria bacterium]|nr:patatin-like phospholipase family protein [Pseudomonadota bacterium]